MARAELIGQRCRIAEVVDVLGLCRRRTNTGPVAEGLICDENRVIVAIINTAQHLHGPAIHRNWRTVETMRGAQDGMRADDCPAAYPVAHGESYSACMGMLDRMRTPCEHKKRCKQEDADMHVSSPSCTT